MPNIIECSNLTKKYDDVIALRNLHFSVERDYRHARRRRMRFGKRDYRFSRGRYAHFRGNPYRLAGIFRGNVYYRTNFNSGYGACRYFLRDRRRRVFCAKICQAQIFHSPLRAVLRDIHDRFFPCFGNRRV